MNIKLDPKHPNYQALKRDQEDSERLQKEIESKYPHSENGKLRLKWRFYQSINAWVCFYGPGELIIQESQDIYELSYTPSCKKSISQGQYNLSKTVILSPDEFTPGNLDVLFTELKKTA